jgi:hypothetical protein
MRVSEKTVELNFCAEATAFLRPAQRLIWFGLTQGQEAMWGFDTCAKLGGRIMIFQFKASNHVLKRAPRTGWRKFHAQHIQMQRLRNLSAHHKRSVFYMLPNFGNSQEFAKVTDLLSSCYLVDVSSFPSTIPSSGKSSSYHNMYLYLDHLRHPHVDIQSKPFKAKDTISAKMFFSRMRGKAQYKLPLQAYALPVLRDDTSHDQKRTKNAEILKFIEDALEHTRYKLDITDVGIPAKKFTERGALVELLGKRRLGMFALGIIQEEKIK